MKPVLLGLAAAVVWFALIASAPGLNGDIFYDSLALFHISLPLVVR